MADVVVHGHAGSQEILATDLTTWRNASTAGSWSVRRCHCSAMSNLSGGAVLRDGCADSDPTVHEFFMDKVFPSRAAEVVPCAGWLAD